MSGEQGNDSKLNNFSRFNEILMWEFFNRQELIEKLDSIKSKIDDWEPKFFDHEVMEALALMRNFNLRYDDFDTDGSSESYERSIDLQWQFLSWIVDVVYPVYYIYHVAPSRIPDSI